ncbi:LTA synthase family protein [Ligilactobacillus equi]|uniref:Sulfatase family protein n=2 Tax=Ligilactobacillus equi TaxID=137357 RepID=V7HWD9_9LACO|nr:LTA synthase family protein [Ligilactobacillus equi]ETA73590.1 sulfatase family protein [Ligilactobacillus equi DPC 6820]KRL80184.1 phosphatidylglycerol--membrane-oligosaccharide glycerophosphotransferase [Ligilactobacillus equi DSM 15833 = JCM 10991]
MRSALRKIQNFLNTRLGFFSLVLFLFWLKTIWTYNTKFTLGINSGVQEILALVNPFPTAILLLGIALYFRGKKVYWIMMIVDVIQTTWLFANILYYREFSDFMSMSIIKSSGSVSNNLGSSIAQIIEPSDFLVFVDIIVLILLLAFKVIKVDYTPAKRFKALGITILAVVLFFLNLGAAEKDRSQLLTRTFDNNYIVKYLGVNFFAGYSGYQTYQQGVKKANASASDIQKILKKINKNRAGVNAEYYGKAAGKNVIIFHLESFQQFLINYKVDGKEITPNINKFYADSNTIAYDNFFNQVGQGKTSDAETMLETSLFGLPSGSAMSTYGTTNTYQALPAILDQRGYSTASFHGDVGSFWNRDNTYKSWGYQYFISKNYYQTKENYENGYGIKDKIFLKQSTKYLEQLPQPFYAKIITVTNHYPYQLDKENQSIPKTKTGDVTVDGYVQTAYYLDQAFGEFIAYLKKTGLYDKTMIVAYGDHYGISNNHKKAIAQLLGKKKVTSYDLAMFQKVPFMIHMPGLKGGVNHTYGGEIDVMPTLMDLLGIKNTDTVQFGNDLLSSQHNQLVIFRNGDFTSPTYTKIGSKVYNNKGELVTDKLTTKEKNQVAKMQDYATDILAMSDQVTTGDLLRFYKPSWFKLVDKSQYSYKLSDAKKALKQAQKTKKSLLSENKGVSTEKLYKTDAPELK